MYVGLIAVQGERLTLSIPLWIPPGTFRGTSIQQNNQGTQSLVMSSIPGS